MQIIGGIERLSAVIDDEYVSSIEGLMFADKTIAVDFHKFEEGGRLLVIGISGSGKTTLGKYLAKKYEVGLCGLDSAWDPFWTDGEAYPKPNGGQSEAEMNQIVKTQMIKMFKAKSGCRIVEGVNLVGWPLQPTYAKEILKLPCIIIGTSVIEATLKAAIRNKKKYDQSIWSSMKNFGWHKEVAGRLDKFRKLRVKVPGAVVEEFEIPKLVVDVKK